MHNLIFDLDGCLIDSSEVQKLAFFGAYKEVVGDNRCPTYDEYMKYTGDSVDNVMAKLHLPPSMATVFRKISSHFVDRIKVNWDAVNWIRELKSKCYKIAICTGKDHYRTVEILNYFNIANCFDALVCADDVKEPKPSPEPVLQALRQLGCFADEAIVIGDGYNDILSARRAGVKSVLALWYGDIGIPIEADYTANTVSELKKIIQGETPY